MVLVTTIWKGEVMEINIRSIPLVGKNSLLLMVIAVKLIAIKRARPTKIISFCENIKSVNNYFSQNIDTVKNFPAANGNS
jgi:hypothetical protein